ncbi:MAG: hypothetical protein LBD03_07085 [Methanobrevibacter sp.]|jgi:hypothetical protein|nr:hypothetical protein [Candidatus Methanovirga procula]
MIVNFKKHIVKNKEASDETGVVSLPEILIGSLIIILILVVFNTIIETHIPASQELNINEVQDILDSMSFKSSPNQVSLLELSMKKLENSHFSKTSYDEVNRLLGTHLNNCCVPNYQLIEFSSSKQIILVNKGNLNNANNLKSAVRNLGDYKFLLYTWN